MAIPASIAYNSEEDFRMQFLLPLFQRLGFSLVMNFHGSREFGKDLLFAEVDRFGNVCYHGLQAKYVGSIGLAEVESLISDCRQAFSNPFSHPQTGERLGILVFYAVNAGTFSDQARDHFFNSLTQQYGPRVRLLDGQALIALDRWATVNRMEWIRELLSGLLLEFEYNKRVLPTIINCLTEIAEGAGFLPMQRLRLSSCLNYLVRPLLPMSDLCNRLETYWHSASGLTQVAGILMLPRGVL